MNEQDKTLPLNKRLASARRAQGIPQSALAKQAGCAQAAVSMMENGRADALSRETIAKIASILKVKIDETPTREVIDVPVDEMLIVELYSK